MTTISEDQLVTEAVKLLRKYNRQKLESSDGMATEMPLAGIIVVEGTAQFKGRSKIFWTAIFSRDGSEMLFLGYSGSFHEAHRMVNQWRTGYWQKQFKEDAA